jgi:hypothetical protein
MRVKDARTKTNTSVKLRIILWGILSPFENKINTRHAEGIKTQTSKTKRILLTGLYAFSKSILF